MPNRVKVDFKRVSSWPVRRTPRHGDAFHVQRAKLTLIAVVSSDTFLERYIPAAQGWIL